MAKHLWGVSKPATAGLFPLSVSSNGRYLQGANGTPFFLQGVAIWSLEVQVNNTEIDQILDATQAKGFTCVLFEAIEHEFSSQSPAYENVDGDAPFASMTDFGSSLVSDYWSRVDYIVNGLKNRGMVAMINPAYLGYSGGSQGWASEISAESDADLQTYGQRLANRYTQGNVIWCMGGDYDGDSTLRAKQWQIVTGIRLVRTTDIITAHTAPNEMASDTWGGGSYAGFNLNNIYGYTEDGYDIPVEADGAYAVSGPIPFFLIESRYEGENSVTAAQLRFQSYTPLLRGACGQIFSNNPLWHLEAGGYSMYSYTDTWEEALDSDGMQDQQRLADLFTAYAWHKLVPKTDSSLISSSQMQQVGI